MLSYERGISSRSRVLRAPAQEAVPSDDDSEWTSAEDDEADECAAAEGAPPAAPLAVPWRGPRNRGLRRSLERASELGDLPTVRRLLRLMPNEAPKALFIASSAGHARVVGAAVDALEAAEIGVDICDEDDATPAWHAARRLRRCSSACRRGRRRAAH